MTSSIHRLMWWLVVLLAMIGVTVDAATKAQYQRACTGNADVRAAFCGSQYPKCIEYQLWELEIKYERFVIHNFLQQRWSARTGAIGGSNLPEYHFNISLLS
ncbi:unnamed protein product [Rotaria magnacalcarata]|uniref:Uncharacterized protein n=1 Tax=Rotaria magnacalcarata TaxID=392030 RepID=A0A819DFW4_9BILA|nr:unnamed protein product [Rotaria magnacalcarata]CAF1675191.1 unnamed protein product [Rotaria magnacalcarata]CAF1965357.1 unnamed protein product [Rotaria magnacalcarata]CAF2083098.1 unnamed protein product [Rotaria magnacalcarata]CAF2156038.1 unnamed protein product [Rotaria magnacalcarata]